VFSCARQKLKLLKKKCKLESMFSDIAKECISESKNKLVLVK
jgi:hypothetical protein